MQLRDFIGIPYKSRGFEFEGCDCYGLAVLFNRHMLDKNLPDYTQLYVSADDADSVAGAIALGRENWIKPDVFELGDLILFKQMGVVSHCGIYLDGIDFLHVRAGESSCLEAMDNIAWNRRIEDIIRWS